MCMYYTTLLKSMLERKEDWKFAINDRGKVTAKMFSCDNIILCEIIWTTSDIYDVDFYSVLNRVVSVHPIFHLNRNSKFQGLENYFRRLYNYHTGDANLEERLIHILLHFKDLEI